MNDKPTDPLKDSAQVLRGMVYFLAREIVLENTHTSIDAQIEVARLCYQDGLDLVEKKPEIIDWRLIEGFPIYEINQYGKVRERISEKEPELLNHGVPFYVLYTFGGLGPASGRYFRTVGELLEKAFPGEEIDHHLGVVKKTEPDVQIHLKGEVSKKDVDQVKKLVEALTNEIDSEVRLRHTSAQISGIVVNRVIQEGWSPK